jgi:alpha-mannosidase
VRAVVEIEGVIGDIPVTQKLVLYHDLKRLDIQNTVSWKNGRFLRIQQLFPTTQSAVITYGVPFGANRSDNLMPTSGPRFQDEAPRENWLRERNIQDWIAAESPTTTGGSQPWTLGIAADHQEVTIDSGIIRAEMVRGARYTSTKVVHGDEIASMPYPPSGTYRFRYSLTSGSGDWKQLRTWQAGPSFNSPLIPVSVVDELSTKSLPATNSFISVAPDNLMVSAVKKADSGTGLVVRFYDPLGVGSQPTVHLFGRPADFGEVNLLEEASTTSGTQPVKLRPYQIETVKFEP